MTDLTHLTSVQIDGILIGDANPAALAHLRSCPACAAQLAAARSSITLFGQALTSMAQQERAQEKIQAVRRPVLLDSRSSRRPLRLTAAFALAASLAIVALTVPFGHLAPPPVAKAPVQAPAANVQSDEALLNEIDQQLSASVPEALAPLEDPTGGQTSTPSTTSNKKD